jgi:hypothetical protein
MFWKDKICKEEPKQDYQEIVNIVKLQTLYKFFHKILKKYTCKEESKQMEIDGWRESSSSKMEMGENE